MLCSGGVGNGFAQGMDEAEEGDGGGGEGEGEEGGGEDTENQWDAELDGEPEGEQDEGVRMKRTDTLHSTTSSTGTQRRRGQQHKKQVCSTITKTEELWSKC